MFRRIIISTTITLIFMSAAAAAFAASVTITPTTAGTYNVQGDGMDGVAGIQLDIAYDTTSLATPTVTQGALVAGAMLAANTSRPGIIKIVIISTRTFSGSGQIALITFGSKTGSGGITSLTSSMIDIKGSPIASSASTPSSETATAGIITTPGVPFSQPSQQSSSSGSSTTTTTAPAAVVSATPTYFGKVTLPADQQQRTDQKPAAPSTVPVNAEEPPAAAITDLAQPAGKPAAGAKAEETPQYVVYKGIIERFRQYNGSKALPSMVALFDKQIAQTIRQEPAILLSDGQHTATLTVDIPARINSSPNFAVNGGTMTSFRQNKRIKGRWIVEVLPVAGSVKATLTIITGVEEFEFPLTVAPPVKTELTLNERGWNRFLKEVGTATVPLHDFNNDGVRDFIDEYIFVANHLAGIITSKHPESTPTKSAK